MSLAGCTAGCLGCGPLATWNKEMTGAGFHKFDNASAGTEIVLDATLARVYQAKIVRVDHAVLCFDAVETE